MKSRSLMRICMVASLALTVSCSGGPDLVSTPWKLIRPARSNTLYVLALSGGCIRFDKIDVDERPNHVILTALSKDLGRPGIGCTGELRMDAIAVCLRAPLADRRLAHATVSKKWTGPAEDKVTVPYALGLLEPCEQP